MRNISTDLATVQAMRSPKIAVSMTVSTRGQNAEAPALEWTELVAPPGSASSNPACAVEFDNGSIVRVVGAPSDLKQQTITEPTDADQWKNNTWTALRTDTADALAAYHHVSSYARLYYITAGNVKYLLTSNSGSSWGAPQNVYIPASAGTAYDLCVNRTANPHALGNTFVCGFTTYTPAGAGAGTYAAYFNAGSNVKYADNWRAAGIYINEDDDAYIYCLVFREPDNGPARLRVVRFDGATFD